MRPGNGSFATEYQFTCISQISCGLFAGVGAVCCAAVMVSICGAAGADEPTNRFGFTGPEIFPIDNQIALLRSADLDGDGLNDLIVVNNSRSKIDLLYNQTGKTNAQKRADSGEVKHEINELPPDARFRMESISSEKRISSLVVADLNGDGKPDIAYFGGDPKGTGGAVQPGHERLERAQALAD